MIYDLPRSIEVDGAEYNIRSDYREILDICAALTDPEIGERDKTFSALYAFYLDFDSMSTESYSEAVEKCIWFINGGEDDDGKKRPRLMDWQQDFKLICAPVNRVLGKEIRSLEYLHWWSFLSAYMEIGGDCTFAQVVGIRDKLARGKKLDKSEREWLNNNRNIVDFRTKYTNADEELFKRWI